jgi:tripartite-type tricarboxylate transporter receptor subunit TctC
MKRRNFTSQFSFALLAGVLAAANAIAQSLPPSILTGTQAPIKLIVPFTPGTGIDLIARTVGPKL